MRAGIGLLSLLIGVAIILYISIGTKSHPGYDATVLEKGKKASQEASQISGRTADNVPIADTIQLDEVDAGGQFRRLKVLSITPDTPMETMYKLKVGDEITRVGDLGVSDNNDAGLGKALVYDAYRQNQNLVVIRDGQEMTLKPTGSPLSELGKPNAPQSQTIPTH